MKYMHSERHQRLDLFVHNLGQDAYLPLGSLEMEAFFTMEPLSLAQASQQAFKALHAASSLGSSEYCWMRTRIILPDGAKGRRIALSLETGGQTTVFVDGKCLGAAGWPAHPFIVDHCGEPFRTYQIMLQAHYKHAKLESERAAMGDMSYGIWNQDAYQLYMDLMSLRALCDEVDHAEKIAAALEKAARIVDFKQDLDARIKSYREASEALKPFMNAANGCTAPIKETLRKAEVALREAEMWGAIASLLRSHYRYPYDRIDAALKLLPLNQLSDISDHKHIIKEAQTASDQAVKALVNAEGFTVLNSLSFPRKGLVNLPDYFCSGAYTVSGEQIPTIKTMRGVHAMVDVPACGAVSLYPCSCNDVLARPSACARLTNTGAVIENAKVRAVLNHRGEVTSFVRKDSALEYAAGAMNKLLAYENAPRPFDAWDIDANGILQPAPIGDPATLTVQEAEGLRAVLHVERKLLHSTFAQDIVLEADSIRLDFVTTVSGHELPFLLKVAFPVSVQAAQGINPFGYMKHRSRLGRFEVRHPFCSALCDESHGAAILSDCKFDISINGNELQLTLLRAAASPQMRTDNGVHTFTYAFVAWEGDFLLSPVVDEAYDLNVPLTTEPGNCEQFSAFALSARNVYIDVVKPAQDGSGDVIVRLYEAKNVGTNCEIYVGLDLDKAWHCDMLENKLMDAQMENGKICLHLHNFEVKTLRLAK